MFRIPLIVLIAFLVACDRAPSQVVLGAAGPWTEGYGAMNKRGIDLAVEEINAAGGIGGTPLQVISRDDGGDGAKAAAIAQEFVNNSNVIAVIGHVNSGAMVAAAKVYDGQLPAVATTATSPQLTGISSWVFRVISSDSANGAEMARFASAAGHRRAAVLYENDSYGRGLADAFHRGFTGEIISIDPIAGGDGNFEPYISFLRRADPDLVFVAGTEAAGIAILREARRQGLNTVFLGGDGWTGIVADQAAAEGAFVGAPFSANDTRTEAQAFVRRFRERYGMTPDGNAALAYDATRLLARLAADGARTRSDMRDRLAALGGTNVFEGVTGRIAFDEFGDPVGKEIRVSRVRGGELVVEGGR